MRPSSNRSAAAGLFGLLAFTLMLMLHPGGAGAQRTPTPTDGTLRPALVLLTGADPATFWQATDSVRANGGEVRLAYPPRSFIANLTVAAEAALRSNPNVIRIEYNAVDQGALRSLS